MTALLQEVMGKLLAAERERDEALAALASCVRYQYGVGDMNGWEEAAAAWTEARRVLALHASQAGGEP